MSGNGPLSLNEFVDIMLRTLTPRESMVIRMSFGIGMAERTSEEIAHALELPVADVQDVLEVAMRKLQHPSLRADLHAMLAAVDTELAQRKSTPP